MSTHRRLLVLAILANLATAQSPLTTFFTSNNNGNAGGAVLFDLTVVAPLTLTQIDVHASTGGVTGTLEVRLCQTSRVGNEQNPAAWTVVSTGNPLVTQPQGTPTPCPLTTPIQLAPGSYGLLLKADTWAHRYTNGNAGNLVHATNELTLTAGAAQNTMFGVMFQPRVFNGSLHYVIGPDVALASPFGRGCYDRSRSFYERFASGGTFDLANSAMMLVFTGTHYVGIAAGGWRTPTIAATPLNVSALAEATVPLPRTFAFPGGTTNQLVVHPFGFVSTAVGNGNSLNLEPTTWVASPQPRWGDWHSFDPALAGSGPVLFEQMGNVAVVTWDGVGDGSGGANWFQLQFDLGNGFVTYAWQAVAPQGGAHLVGFAAGGPSNDLGPLDLSAVLGTSFTTSATDDVSLRHRADRPVLGTTANLWAERLNGSTLGAIGIGLGAIANGIDLAALGARGCRQYSTLETLVLLPAGANGRLTWPVPVPATPALAGVQLASQAAALVPGSNDLGVLTSNGIDLRLHVR